MSALLADLLPDELDERLRAGAPPLILDVRTRPEYTARHIPGALLIPVDELAARQGELDPDDEIVVVCEHGIRSAAAVEFLRRAGFEQVRNMRRGMAAWTGEVERGDAAPSR
jgi:sulfur-carrier protein adenylyltransferase/sulfurtransferase